MTEKRSDYRKRQQQNKKGVFEKVKDAFNDNQEEDLDVNPDFKNDSENQEESPSPIRRSLKGDGEPDLQDLNAEDTRKLTSEEKGLKLKKRLNQTILILVVLIILVLVALFHL